MRISDWSSDVCSSDRIVLVEDAMLLFLGYSCAIVGDFHTVFSVTDIGPDRDCWIRGVIVLDRIGDQVDQHLAEPVGVGGHDRLGNARLRLHDGAVLAGERTANAQRSEVRRVGTGGVTTGKYRWARYKSKKQ